MFVLATLLLALCASALPTEYTAGTDFGMPANYTAGDDLEPRALPGCHRRTTLVGDGNPHQVYLRKQISTPMWCGRATCTVGKSSSESFSIGANLGGSYEWISGGFSVQKTYETGNSHECQGGPGDTVCIWKKIAHTAYSVRSQGFGANPDCADMPTTKHVIKSPNSHERGSKFYCMVNRCHDIGYSYWDRETRPGGP